MKTKAIFALTILCLAAVLASWSQNPPGGYGPGQGGVTFPLLAPAGTLAAPSYSFVGVPSSGMTAAGGLLTIVAAGASIAAFNGSGITVQTGNLFTPVVSSGTYVTTNNCSSSASPAVCGSAAAGSFVLPAAATTITVNTTAVTANSQIIVINDDSLGTKLSVTCNTALDQVFVSARVAATSFTITGTAPVTNPNCYSYLIIN